jgi:hypothetical protein
MPKVRPYLTEKRRVNFDEHLHGAFQYRTGFARMLLNFERCVAMLA